MNKQLVKLFCLLSLLIPILLILTKNNSAQIVLPSSSSVTANSCTNQTATGIASDGTLTCTTLTSVYVNNSIALTGTDVNTSNQVTATHLASALPTNQGGTGNTNGTVGTLTTTRAIYGNNFDGSAALTQVIGNIFGGTGIGAGLPNECDERLTLTSGLPITTADVIGATSVYVTPYKGNVCWFYDGSANWTALTFSEITVALGTLTSGQAYDIFCYNNSGVMACDAPLAWTSGTARATALVLQNGIYVKSGTTTRRYLGSFYTTATTTTEDSFAKALLCNYYNRVPRAVRRLETTASWTYATDTLRQANASTANQIAVMACLAEERIDLFATSHGYQASAATALGFVTSIGENSTTASATGALFNGTSSPATVAASDGQELNAFAKLNTVPAVGYSYYAWLERSFTSTTTFIGINSGYNQTGINGTWVH